jgi:hypothetical protein
MGVKWIVFIGPVSCRLSKHFQTSINTVDLCFTGKLVLMHCVLLVHNLPIEKKFSTKLLLSTPTDKYLIHGHL